MKARRLGLASCIVLLLSATATRGRPDDGPKPVMKRFAFDEPHMGSVFSVVLYTPDESIARRASRAAFDRIAALDDALSDYNPDSELMRLVAKAGGPPVAVGDDLFAVLSRSQELWKRSDGALDVTIAPVVRLWRRARREKKRPDPDLLARALALVGGDAIELDPARRTVRLARPGMKLDLGAIAKGYASQAAIEVLKKEGVTSALVAGSGDIVVSDPPPGREGWSIGVAPLLQADADGKSGATILLKNAAVSTSGDAEQFVELDGVRYSHVIDPKTGLGLTERRSVTVIAPDGATADGLDTAACVLGPERGMAMVGATQGAHALFVRLTPKGTETIASPGWAGFLRPAGRP